MQLSPEHKWKVLLLGERIARLQTELRMAALERDALVGFELRAAYELGEKRKLDLTTGEIVEDMELGDGTT